MFPAGNDAGEAYARWQTILTQAGQDHDTMAAGELYTGQHWGRPAAMSARTGTELWVLSAGLGLLHVTDPVVPYEATFAAMPFNHQALWDRLTGPEETVLQLDDYIQRHYQGVQAGFARAAGVKPQQVKKWLQKRFIVVNDVLYSHRRAL